MRVGVGGLNDIILEKAIRLEPKIAVVVLFVTIREADSDLRILLGVHRLGHFYRICIFGLFY